jgi:hypothetical protein
LGLLLCSLAAAQNPDPVDIIRKSVDRDLLNFERLKNYTYTERDEDRSFDKNGKLTKTEVETYEIMILGGRAYGRLIERNDKPLSEKDARKEQQKMDEEVAKRERESPSEKAKLDKEREKDRAFLRELPDALNFKLEGEDTVSGKPAWVISAEPKPGYQPKDIRAKMITRMRGKVWIDKAEYQWVKVDAQAIEKLSFGFKLVQVEPGASIQFEQTRVNDEVWLPAAAKIHADARVAYLKHVRGELDLTFKDYKKFQVESRIVTDSAGPPPGGADSPPAPAVSH